MSYSREGEESETPSGEGESESGEVSQESSEASHRSSESEEEMKKPSNLKDRLSNGLTSQLGIANVEARPTQLDVEDMIDEGNDSDKDQDKNMRKTKKAKMKKLRHFKHKDGTSPGIQKDARTNPKEKLQKVARSLFAFAQNKKETEQLASQDKGQDPTLAATLKKEKEKHSNVQFLSKIAETEDNHGDLTFGSYIVLNIEKEDDDPRKFTTNFRISDKVQAIKMDKEDYDPNCVFRIIPASQNAMLTKMRRIVEEENIPLNAEIDYENFMSEMQANVDVQEDFMGKPVKYGAKFQLVQESSKRFLCIHEAKSDAVKDIFEDRYVDSLCFYFGFSEYPSKYTHFFIKE